MVEHNRKKKINEKNKEKYKNVNGASSCLLFYFLFLTFQRAINAISLAHLLFFLSFDPVHSCLYYYFFFLYIYIFLLLFLVVYILFYCTSFHAQEITSWRNRGRQMRKKKIVALNELKWWCIDDITKNILNVYVYVLRVWFKWQARGSVKGWLIKLCFVDIFQSWDKVKKKRRKGFICIWVYVYLCICTCFICIKRKEEDDDGEYDWEESDEWAGNWSNLSRFSVARVEFDESEMRAMIPHRHLFFTFPFTLTRHDKTMITSFIVIPLCWWIFYLPRVFFFVDI